MYSLNWPINIGTCNKNLVRVILILDLNAIRSGLQILPLLYHWMASIGAVYKPDWFKRTSAVRIRHLWAINNNNIVQCTVYAYYIYACTIIVLEYLCIINYSIMLSQYPWSTYSSTIIMHYYCTRVLMHYYSTRVL